MLGRTLFKEVYNFPSNKIMIDINGMRLPAGIYNVAVYNDKTIKTNKILIR